MGCSLAAQNNGFTPLTFNCSSTNIGAILSDGGNGLSFGSFNMQQGTYEVGFYSFANGCGSIDASIDFGAPVARWFTSTINQCGTPLGIMALAQIMQFGPNQTLRFVPSPLNSGAVNTLQFPLSQPVTTLIITKLQ